MGKLAQIIGHKNQAHDHSKHSKIGFAAKVKPPPEKKKNLERTIGDRTPQKTNFTEKKLCRKGGWDQTFEQRTIADQGHA